MVNILDETVGFRFNQPHAANEGNGRLTHHPADRPQPAAGAGHRQHRENPQDPGAGTAVPVTDYTPATLLLSFLAGQTSKTFTVPLKNDTALDGTRTINLALSAPTWASSRAARGDDDGRRQPLRGNLPLHQRDLHRHRGRQRQRLVYITVQGQAAPEARSTSPGASRAAPRLTTTSPAPAWTPSSRPAASCSSVQRAEQDDPGHHRAHIDSSPTRR